MARANNTNKKSSPSVSLFPFLSILACVMGTLTLIIYGVALGQTQDGPSEQAYQQVIDMIAQITVEIERLKVMIAQALEREKQLSDLRDEIAWLQSMLPGFLDEMKQAAVLLPQYEELKRQVGWRPAISNIEIRNSKFNILNSWCPSTISRIRLRLQKTV